MNSINLVGRLTADPEVKQTTSGKSVCTFTLAVNRPRVKDVTDFIHLSAWNQSAEYLASYGHKGSLVAATGVLTTRKYDDKFGNHRTAFEIVCDHVSICESRDKTSTAKTNYGSFTEAFADSLEMCDSDDIPF